MTKGRYVQDLVDVFVNYEREVNRGKITIKITGALLYIFQHLVGSSKNFKLFQIAFPFKGVSDLKACLDYCEDRARSCENLNFCFPAQTELFY